MMNMHEIHYAASCGDTAEIKRLIEQEHVDPNLKTVNSLQLTPLFFAQDIPTAALLLKLKADVKYANRISTGFYCNIREHHRPAPLIEFLLESKADYNLPAWGDKEGSALTLALIQNDSALIGCLLERRFSVTRLDVFYANACSHSLPMLEKARKFFEFESEIG